MKKKSGKDRGNRIEETAEAKDDVARAKCREIAGKRGNIADRAAAVFNHHRNDVLAAQEHALQVQVDALVPKLHIGIADAKTQAGFQGHAAVVDQKINPSVFSHNRSDHVLDGILNRHVAIHREALCSALLRDQLSRTQATLESAKKDQQADAMIRKISHDLNNHILSLHHLLGAGEYEKAAQYLDHLRHSIPAKKPVIHTGNLILDSLFAEKLSKAEALGAEIMINADLTPFSAVSDFDQCTIFGNILDNAIEACSKVQHKDARYIYLRSRPYAGYTVFTLSNSYEGSRTDASGRFLTTKKDVNNHGYGLSNVRAAVEKHGGVLHVHANQEKQEFQLSIMLPTAPYAKTTASDSP